MFRPQKASCEEDDFPLINDMDPEITKALMESGSGALDRLSDADFFRKFEDDFIEDDLD